MRAKVIATILGAILSPAATAHSDTAVTAIRIGLEPRAMAAAGLSPGSVQNTIHRLTASQIVQNATLAQADAHYTNARLELLSLADQIRRRVATPAVAAQFPLLQQALEQQRLDRQALLHELFAHATAELTSDQRTRLKRIHANRKRPVPTEFLVTERSEPEWAHLSKLILAERLSAGAGVTLSAAHQTQIANYRSQPQVANAKASIDATVHVLSSTWELAVQ